MSKYLQAAWACRADDVKGELFQTVQDVIESWEGQRADPEKERLYHEEQEKIKAKNLAIRRSVEMKAWWAGPYGKRRRAELKEKADAEIGKRLEEISKRAGAT